MVGLQAAARVDGIDPADEVQVLVQQPDTSSVSADPDILAAVLVECVDEVVAQGVDFPETVGLRNVEEQPLVRADHDPAVLEQAGADDEIVGEVIVRDVLPEVRPEAEEAVAVGRYPEFPVHPYDVLDVDEGVVRVAETLHLPGLGVEEVERTVLGAHPKPSGRCRTDGADDVALDRTLGAAGIVQLVGVALVEPEVQALVERSRPYVALAVGGHAHYVTRGNGVGIGGGLLYVSHSAVALRAYENARLGTDPELSGHAFHQAADASGLGIMEYDARRQGLGIEEYDVVGVGRGQEQSAGGAGYMPEFGRHLEFESVPAAVVTVEGSVSGGEPDRAEGVRRHRHRVEIVCDGVFRDHSRLDVVTVGVGGEEPDVAGLVLADLADVVLVEHAYGDGLARVDVIGTGAVAVGEPQPSCIVHEQGGGHSRGEAVGSVVPQLDEIMSVETADAVPGPDPDEVVFVLHDSVDGVARETVGRHVVVEPILLRSGRLQAEHQDKRNGACDNASHGQKLEVFSLVYIQRASYG